MLFCHYWTIESMLGAVVLDVNANQCRTFSVTSGDFWHWIFLLCIWIEFCLQFLYLWFHWVFHTCFLFRFKSKKIFNLSVWFLMYA